MSDEEWACFEPFVTVRGAHSGRRPKDRRLVLDGIFWIARTGAQWRDLHEHFGKWSSVYRNPPVRTAISLDGVVLSMAFAPIFSRARRRY